jgi:transposase-like protein
VEHFLDQQWQRGKIGGVGVTVQLDESKFGKRKYNHGRRTEGHWMLGMIADGSNDLRLILCPNNKRGANELLPIIQKHVEPGTIIRTDMWKAYNDLGELGYQHKVVNHSDKTNPFVAPDGTHTNRIESSAKDYFRTVRQRSVCTECQGKLNICGEAAVLKAQEVNREQDECMSCDGVESPCPDHKKKLKAIKSTVRKKIRETYDDRANCDECNMLAEKFADKMVEYLWRRQMKKEERNTFMELIRALVASNE